MVEFVLEKIKLKRVARRKRSYIPIDKSYMLLRRVTLQKMISLTTDPLCWVLTLCCQNLYFSWTPTLYHLQRWIAGEHNICKPFSSSHLLLSLLPPPSTATWCLSLWKVLSFPVLSPLLSTASRVHQLYTCLCKHFVHVEAFTTCIEMQIFWYLTHIVVAPTTSRGN